VGGTVVGGAVVGGAVVGTVTGTVVGAGAVVRGAVVGSVCVVGSVEVARVVDSVGAVVDSVADVATLSEGKVVAVNVPVSPGADDGRVTA
jgi:hypothetical protein